MQCSYHTHVNHAQIYSLVLSLLQVLISHFHVTNGYFQVGVLLVIQTQYIKVITPSFIISIAIPTIYVFKANHFKSYLFYNRSSPITGPCVKCQFGDLIYYRPESRVVSRQQSPSSHRVRVIPVRWCVRWWVTTISAISAKTDFSLSVSDILKHSLSIQ